MTSNSLVRIKSGPVYSADLEVSVLTNSLVRATLDQKTGSYSFPKKLPTKVQYDSASIEAAGKAIASEASLIRIASTRVSGFHIVIHVSLAHTLPSE